MLDTKRIKACAPLLPPPGDTVVLELVAEIERLYALTKVEHNATNDQLAQIMMLHGTKEQVLEATLYLKK